MDEHPLRSRLRVCTVTFVMLKILVLAAIMFWAVLTLLPGKPVLANNSSPLFEAETARLAEGLGDVEGYPSADSVRQGGTIDFHVSTDSIVISYDIQIFRAGASGLTLMTMVQDLPGGNYPCGPTGAEANQEELLLGCDWPVAYTLSVPTDWPSGLYLANLLDENDKPGLFGSYIFFIVTEDQPGSTADILFHFPTYTWQAYNSFGLWSFYTTPPARRITFDRPHRYRCTPLVDCRPKWELPLARWLESEGYAVEYVASQDIDTDPALLFNYSLFITAGHDEYWTKELRDNIDTFIDAGGNVAIISGNTGFRQVRYYDQDDRRTLVCYKSDYKLDPLYGIDNIRLATEFGREPVPSWPENSTTGLGWRNGGYVRVSSTITGEYTVYRSGHWVYANTGLQDGDIFVYETQDKIEVDGALFTWENGLPVVTGQDETPLNFTILGLQPATSGYATMGLYSRAGGGTVFNAATMGWGRGLWPENNPNDYQIVRQITRNVVDQLSSGDPLPPPVFAVQSASFTHQPQYPAGGEVVTFTATITPVYASQPVTYTWQFGDGASAVVTNSGSVSHTFTDGSYPVALLVDNLYGQAVYSRPLTVKTLYPVQDTSFTYQPTQPFAGDMVTFTAAITPVYASQPVTYTWQFEGMPPVFTGSPVISYTYVTAGLHPVSLIAANVMGQSTYSRTVGVAARDQPEKPTYLYLPIVIKGN